MDSHNIHRVDRWAEIRAGVADIAPAAIAAIPIGFLFGAIAVQKGLSPAEVSEAAARYELSQ